MEVPLATTRDISRSSKSFFGNNRVQFGNLSSSLCRVFTWKEFISGGGASAVMKAVRFPSKCANMTMQAEAKEQKATFSARL